MLGKARIPVRCFLILFLGSCFACAPPAAAADDSHIGLFADDFCSSCGADYQPYVQITVYVFAVLDGLNSITAAEFRVANLPDNSGYPVGQISSTWTTSLCIGDIETGVALAFMDAQYGPEVRLGQLDFTGYDGNWIAENHRIHIAASLTTDPATDTPTLVDEVYETYDVWGGRFTFNPSSPEMAECGRAGSAASGWGELKSLY